MLRRHLLIGECCDENTDQPAVIDFSAPEDNIWVYANPFTDKLNM
ncbi:MAG: hypothetical protein V8R52_14010 [Coprobacter fastidiosus]